MNKKTVTTTTRFSRTVKEYEYEMGIISQATMDSNQASSMIKSYDKAGSSRR